MRNFIILFVCLTLASMGGACFNASSTKDEAPKDQVIKTEVIKTEVNDTTDQLASTKTRKYTTPQCTGTTKTGNRCKRHTADPSGRCPNHRN